MTRRLGRAYELIEPIGHGAMGQVWRGRNTETGEAIAAKLLRSEYTADTDILQRFVQERSILLSVRHHNLVQVRDLVVEGADLAIIMDLVEGGDLRTYSLEHCRLPVPEAVAIVGQVLEALSVIHAARVFHRDVKPENVLLDRTTSPPTPKLSDFGIARLAEGTAVRSSQLIGTPDYLAPEVISAEIITPAADVYACGVMLYELLGGRTPFAGQGTAAAVMMRQIRAEPPPLVGVPSALAETLDLLLVKDASTRPDAAAAAAMLRGLEADVAAAGTLPEQPIVTDWQLPNDAGDDIGGHTIIKGRAITGPESLDEAPVWTPTADDADGDLERGTRVFEREQISRVPAPPEAPPVPEVPAAPANKRNILIASVGMFVLVAAVLFFALGRDGKGDGAAAKDKAAVVGDKEIEASDGRSYPLLEVRREYRLEPDETGTFTFIATVVHKPQSNLELSGDVREVLPESILRRSAVKVTSDTANPVGLGTVGVNTTVWNIDLDGAAEQTTTFELRGVELEDSELEAPDEIVRTALREAGDELEAQIQRTAPGDSDKLFLAASGLEINVQTATPTLASGIIDYDVELTLGSTDSSQPVLLLRSEDGAVSPTQMLASFGGLDRLKVTGESACASSQRRVTPRVEGSCTITAMLGPLDTSTDIYVGAAE